MHALIQDGTVWQTFTEDPQLGAGFEVQDVSSITGIAPGWIAKADGSYEAPPAIEVPALIPAITRAQAKIQLRRAGLRDEVEALIEAADPEVQDWYAEAGQWQRDNPHVAEIGSALHLTASEIDDLFLAASKIAA